MDGDVTMALNHPGCTLVSTQDSHIVWVSSQRGKMGGGVGWWRRNRRTNVIPPNNFDL